MAESRTKHDADMSRTYVDKPCFKQDYIIYLTVALETSLTFHGILLTIIF